MGMNEGISDVSFLVEWSQAKSGEGISSKWVEMLNLGYQHGLESRNSAIG